MRQLTEEQKAEQAQYYVRLNEILVKTQNGEFAGYAAESEINKLNQEFPNLYSKASPCIIEAMTNEYANFDENSSC